LVIDEVGAFSRPLQAALMRRLGDMKARLFSTASRGLAELREDLFYALAVLQVPLPPLTERTRDIPALAASFLGDHVLSAEALAALKAHAWPGNVRELKAAMTHAAAVCGGGTILPHHLPSSIVKSDEANHLEDMMKHSLAAWLDQKTTGADESMPAYDDLLETVESSMLETLLKRFENKPTRVAAALRMNRATLRRKLRED